MAKGISVHIGLNKVDPAHYDGWDGALNACEFDAADMRTIAEAAGYQARTLLNEEATADAVLAALGEAAGELEAGDQLLVTYSGHGGQVPDRNGEDEVDRTDETWVTFDRQLVDDELYDAWARFAPGVRILVISDSCHSGTVTRGIEDESAVPDVMLTRGSAAERSPRLRALPRDVMIATYRAHPDLYDGIQERLPSHADPRASVLLISGCRDDQLSLDGFSNGLFTENLRGVWADGTWDGGHAAFHSAILARMPENQQPQYTRVGGDDPGFEELKPFTIAGG